MIAVDTNVLVFADREELPRHEDALRVLRGLAEGHEPWALPVFVVGEYLRVVTHPRLFDPPTPLADALGQIDALLASPTARLLLPGPHFLPLLDDLLRAADGRGNLVFDGQIAAVCREHGATLLTEDRDFARFGVRTCALDDFSVE